MAAGREHGDCDQRAQQRDGKRLEDAFRHRRLKDSWGHDVAGHLQRGTNGRGDDHGKPQPHLLHASSSATPMSPPRRIGAPTGTNGTVNNAMAPEASAVKPIRVLRSRGARSAVNAAGPATSRPLAAGEPSALPASAPTIVEMFQRT